MCSCLLWTTKYDLGKSKKCIKKNQVFFVQRYFGKISTGIRCISDWKHKRDNRHHPITQTSPPTHPTTHSTPPPYHPPHPTTHSTPPKEYTVYQYRIKGNLPSSLFPGLLPQKAEKRNTAHLSAAWGTNCWVQRFLCKVYTVGWVDFGLFKIFMHLHVVCGSPRYNTRKYQISLTFVLKGQCHEKSFQTETVGV